MPKLEVTLSFDNGPEPGVTQRVLEVLKKEKIRASFFVLGAKLADPSRRQLAAQAHALGHWIGNHTMTHAVPLGKLRTAGAAAREIREAQNLIGELAHPERLFRPFGGGGALGDHLLNQEALEVLRAEKMTCVLWNAIPRDFAEPDNWVQRALEQCAAQPWTLIVLHDLPNGAMNHLEAFIRGVRARGGAFRQDFPPGCVPVRRGQIVGDLSTFVSG